MLKISGVVYQVASFTSARTGVVTNFVDLEGHIQVNLPPGYKLPKRDEVVEYAVNVRHLDGGRLMFVARDIG